MLAQEYLHFYFGNEVGWDSVARLKSRKDMSSSIDVS